MRHTSITVTSFLRDHPTVQRGLLLSSASLFALLQRLLPESLQLSYLANTNVANMTPCLDEQFVRLAGDKVSAPDMPVGKTQ